MMKDLIPAQLPFSRKHILEACASMPSAEHEDEVFEEAHNLAVQVRAFLAQYNHDIQDARFIVHRVGETRAEYWPTVRMELEFGDAIRRYIHGDIENGWKPKVRRPKPGTFGEDFFQEFLDWYSSPQEGIEYDRRGVLCDPATHHFQREMRRGKDLRDDMPRRICFGKRYDEVEKGKRHLKESDYSWVPDQYWYYWAEYKHPLPGQVVVEPDLDKCIALAEKNELPWPDWVPESIKDPDYIKKFFKVSEFC